MTTRTGHTLSAVLDAGGRGAALYTVDLGRPWRLGLMAATGSSRANPNLRVYLNGVLLDSTATANNDTSELAQSVDLMPGDQVRADWSGGTTGATMVLTLSGTADD